ncbi:Hypothetical protein SCF082_LOCUS49046, partial [Durusdinium trenchii]
GVLLLRESCDAAGVRLRNDWEAVRTVMVCQGRIREAFERVKVLRAVEERLALDSIDPLEAYDEVQRVMPDAVRISGVDAKGRVVCFVSLSKFFPGKISGDQEPFMIRYLLTMMEITACSLQEFENGVAWYADASDIGLRNVSFRSLRQYGWTLRRGPAFKTKRVALLKCGALFKPTANALKLFLSAKMQQRIVVSSNDANLRRNVDGSSIPVNASVRGLATRKDLRALFSQRLEAFREHEACFRI